MELQVIVDRVVDGVSVGFGPLYERLFPFAKLRRQWSSERNTMSLQARRDRDRNTGCGRPSWCRRCRCWLLIAAESWCPCPAAMIGRRRTANPFRRCSLASKDTVVATSPLRGYVHRQTSRPVASVRRCPRRDRLLSAGDALFAPDLFGLSAKSLDDHIDRVSSYWKGVRTADRPATTLNSFA